MAVALRAGELTVIPGGRGLGPGRLVLDRSSVINDLMDRLVECDETARWHENAAGTHQTLAKLWRKRQAEAHARLGALDGPGSAA